MKNKWNAPALSLGLAVLLLGACSQSEMETQTQSEGPSIGAMAHQPVRAEITQLIGAALSDPAVAQEVYGMMTQLDPAHPAVSLAALWEINTGRLRGEDLSIDASYQKTQPLTSSLFISAANHLLDSDPERFPRLSAGIKSEGTAQKGSYWENLLAEDPLQLYQLHSADKSQSSAKSEALITLTYVPDFDTQSNEAWTWDGPGSIPTSAGMVTNDDLFEEAIWVLGPIDPCDLSGGTCDAVEVFPAGTASGGSSGYLPPPTAAVPLLLPYNVNHEDVLEEDVLSTVIPMIKLNTRSWLGFGATHQKLSFWRASPDGVPSISNGVVVPSGKNYAIGKIRFRAQQASMNLWHPVYLEFDADWNQSENEELLVVFSEHHFSGSASTSAELSAGFDLKEGKIIPTPKATVKVGVTIKAGGTKLRGQQVFSRRQVLATIVGPGLSGQETTHGTVSFNVKKVSELDFFFTHYYTDL